MVTEHREAREPGAGNTEDVHGVAPRPTVGGGAGRLGRLGRSPQYSNQTSGAAVDNQVAILHGSQLYITLRDQAHPDGPAMIRGLSVRTSSISPWTGLRFYADRPGLVQYIGTV